MAGDILRVRGHSLTVGDVLRVGVRDCCPRRRRRPLAAERRARPRGMSPAVSAAVREAAGRRGGVDREGLRCSHLARAVNDE